MSATAEDIANCGVTPAHLRRTLAHTALANRFTDEQIRRLASLCVESEHAPGDIVLREGQISNRLFLIESGQTDVVKGAEDSDGEEFVIRRFADGELFGDMSFLDGEPASATVRVATPTRLLSLSRVSLEGGDALQHATYETILRAMASINAQRLRRQTGVSVESLRAELQSEKIKNEAAQFLILIVIVFGIQNFTGIMIQAMDIDPDHPLYEWGVLLTFLAPSLYFARRFGYSWASMGVTLHNWKQSLVETAMIAPLIIGAIGGGRWLILQNADATGEASLFTSRLIDERPWEFFVYLAHAGLQELGSRGIFQGSLQRFLGPGKGLQAVLVISIMFGILHLHLGMAVVIPAFLGSLFFGYLYLRHGTLLGVTLLHYLAGILIQLMGLM